MVSITARCVALGPAFGTAIPGCPDGRRVPAEIVGRAGVVLVGAPPRFVLRPEPGMERRSSFTTLPRMGVRVQAFD